MLCVFYDIPKLFIAHMKYVTFFICYTLLVFRNLTHSMASTNVPNPSGPHMIWLLMLCTILGPQNGATTK